MDGPVGIATHPTNWTLDAAYAYATQRAVAPADPDGEPLYNCPFRPCAKQFSKRFNLKAHLRVHTGDKPFACPFPGCTRRFMWKSSLTSHQTGHSRRKHDFQRRNAVMAGRALAAESFQNPANLPLRNSAYPHSDIPQHRFPAPHHPLNVLSASVQHTTHHQHHQRPPHPLPPLSQEQSPQHQTNSLPFHHPQDQQASSPQPNSSQNPPQHHPDHPHPHSLSQHPQLIYAPVEHRPPPSRSHYNPQLSSSHRQNTRPIPPTPFSHHTPSDPSSMSYITAEYPSATRDTRNESSTSLPAHFQSQHDRPPSRHDLQSLSHAPLPRSDVFTSLRQLPTNSNPVSQTAPPPQSKSEPTPTLQSHSHPRPTPSPQSRLRPQPKSQPSEQPQVPPHSQPQPQSDMEEQSRAQSQVQRQEPQPVQQLLKHSQSDHATPQLSRSIQDHHSISRPSSLPNSQSQQQFPPPSQTQPATSPPQSQSIPCESTLARPMDVTMPSSHSQSLHSLPNHSQPLHAFSSLSQPMHLMVSHSQALHTQPVHSQPQPLEASQRSPLVSQGLSLGAQHWFGQGQPSDPSYLEQPPEKVARAEREGEKIRVPRQCTDREKLLEEQRLRLQRQEEQIKEQQRIIQQHEERQQAQQRQLQQFQQEREERSLRDTEKKEPLLLQTPMQETNPSIFPEHKPLRGIRQLTENNRDMQMTLPKLEDSSQRFQHGSLSSLLSPIQAGPVPQATANGGDRLGRRDTPGGLPKAPPTLMSPASLGLTTNSVLPSPSASLGLSRSPNGHSTHFLFPSNGTSPSWATPRVSGNAQPMMVASPKPPHTPTHSHMDVQMANTGPDHHGNLSPAASEIAMSPGMVTSPVPPPILPQVSGSCRPRRGLNRPKPPLGGPILSSSASSILPPLTNVTPANPPTHIEIKGFMDDDPSCSLPALGSPHTELSPLPVASPIFGNGHTPQSPLQPYSPFSGLNSLSSKGKQGVNW